MIKTEKQARAIQARRMEAGRPGIAKAMRRWARQATRRSVLHELPKLHSQLLGGTS